MNNTFNHIVSTPGVLQGKPCIKGTRIGVSLILEWLANGSSIQQITREFPQLSEEAVKEAIQYAARLSENDVFTEIAVAS